MSNTKKLFSNAKIIILLIFLLLSIVAIHPAIFGDGAAIRTVVKESAAAQAQPIPFSNPKATSSPMSREVIKTINNIDINDEEDYYNFVKTLEADKTVFITTNKGTYSLKTKAITQIIELNETETVQVEREVFNNETNETAIVIENVTQAKTVEKVIGVEDLGLIVYDAPTNNIRKGLDLEGGTRVILQPETAITSEDTDMVIQNIKQRLNVYGVSDVIVRSVKDFTGENYILVEIAGVSQDEIKDLLSKQGKFEAKVGNTTVFKGGNDIAYVCRTSECSGIDPNTGCSKVIGGNEEEAWQCAFRFSISLSQEAAKAQANATAGLDVIKYQQNREGYLSENLSLILDDELVDELRIGEGLKGNAVTDIQISGSGTGATKQIAVQDALDNMKKLQTVLVTGSLPVKLTIAQSSTISPALGDGFIKNAFLVGLLALSAVVAVILIRYKKPKIAIPVIITMVSEIVILMGFAAIIGWRLDLAAIAGVIIAVGTGVDDQIVLTDEILGRKKGGSNLTWKEKIKRAFFIIMTAYFTTVAAMLPLWWSGAGLLKGFALTTIAGVTIGVFITRPAFAAMMEILFGKIQSEEDEV